MVILNLSNDQFRSHLNQNNSKRLFYNFKIFYQIIVLAKFRSSIFHAK